MPPLVQSYATFPITQLGGSPWAITVNKPSGVVDGDLLIAVIGVLGSTIATVPSGWTLILREATGGTGPINLYTYQKIASSEPSSWTWNATGNSTCAGSVIRITSFDSSTPVDTSAGGASSGTSLTFTDTVTPTRDNCLLLFPVMAFRGATGLSDISAYAITTSNPAWTELYDLNWNVGGSTIEFTLAWASRPQTTATGNSTATANASAGDAGGQMVCIKRSTIIPINASDTQGVTESVSIGRTIVVNASDTQPVDENVVVTRSKQWNNTSKPADTWGSNQVKR